MGVVEVAAQAAARSVLSRLRSEALERANRSIQSLRCLILSGRYLGCMVTGRLPFVRVWLLCAALPCACVSLDPTDSERQAALRYSQDAPFVLGEGASDSGSEDPLVLFREFPGYGGHTLFTEFEVRQGASGVEEATAKSTELVLLVKQGLPTEALAERVRAEACVPPVTCGPTVLVSVRYSLRELRSVMGWVSRSPIGVYLPASSPIERQSPEVYRSVALFEGRADTLALLDRMLKNAAVPADAYRLLLSRPFN